LGAPQAIIEPAGGENATEDIEDTWTQVSWERNAKAKPDFIAINDYGEQDLASKIEILKENPATKDLPAVKHDRFLSLPIVMWTSGPLIIDSAELLRKRLEEASLVPGSDIKSELKLDK